MDILNAVKLRVGIKDELQDDLLNELISDAKARVLAYINQDGVVTKHYPTTWTTSSKKLLCGCTTLLVMRVRSLQLKERSAIPG